MREYHQPYSEIEKMGIVESTFYIELAEELAIKRNHELDKLKNKNKGK